MANDILPQLHGLIVVHKPKGITSNACIQKIKRLGQKKIGHAGTLDPLTEGVLLVLLGQATKLASYLLQGGGKVYKGTLVLGKTTDTWDTDGRVLEERSYAHVREDDLAAAVADWVLLKEQEVPPYSAAKEHGQPLYKLARKGTIVSKTKQIRITQANVLSIRMPAVEFRVHCSSGTYIRSLVHSLGNRFSCGAVLSELIREYSYPFGLERAVALDRIVDDPGSLVRALIPLRMALPDWPALPVPSFLLDTVMHGHSVPASFLPPCGEKTHAILMQGDCELALATRVYEGGEIQWKVTRGLWTNEHS